MVLTSINPLAGIAERYARYLQLCRPHIDRLDTGFGLGGVALYFLYKHRWQEKTKDLQIAQSLFGQMLGEMPSVAKRNSFLIELSELAYFIRQYSHELNMAEDAEGHLNIMDEMLLAHTNKLIQHQLLDPYTGAFQSGYYFLHYPQYFENIIDDLLAAIHHQLLQKDSKKEPWALGISHGLAFYLIFTCKAIENGSQYQPRMELLEKLCQLILEAEKDIKQYTCYFPETNGQRSRLCLAYGDLGILYALLKAAKLLGDEELFEQVSQKLRLTSKRKQTENTGIVDDKLLYGRAGVNYFFHSMWLDSSDPVFDTASQYWREKLEFSLVTQAIPVRPGFQRYNYAAMQKVSLYEGLTGSLLTQMAIDTQSDDFRNLFYLI